MERVLNSENAIEDINRLRRNDWRRMVIERQFSIAAGNNCVADSVKNWNNVEGANDRNIGVCGLMIVG